MYQVIQVISIIALFIGVFVLCVQWIQCNYTQATTFGVCFLTITNNTLLGVCSDINKCSNILVMHMHIRMSL